MNDSNRYKESARNSVKQNLQQALEALDQERDFLKSLVRSLPDLIWLKDPQGVYLACNPVFEHFFGATEEEIVGKTDYDFVNKELADFFREHDRKVLAKGSPSTNEEWITFACDGHKALLETTKTPLVNSQGQVIGVLGVGHDITERKATEEALRKSEARLKEAQRLTRLGNWELDFAQGKLLWSDEIFRIFELDPDEFVPSYENFLNAIHPEDRRAVDAAYQRSVKERTPYSVTHRLIIDHDRIKYVQEQGITVYGEDGQPLRSIGTLQDITERKQAERSLWESSQRYEAVLASTKDGFWLVDMHGQLLEVNDAYCQYSGFSRAELLSLHVWDLDVNDDPAEMRRRIEAIIQEGGTIFESLHRRKDHSIWPVEVSISYSSVQDRQFFCFIRDITERKEAEQLGLLRQRLVEIVYTDDQKSLLQTALDTAEQMTCSEIGFFHFVERDQEMISLQTWSTRTLKEMCYAEGDGLHYPVSQAGVWVDCIHQRRPVIHNDYASLPHQKGLPEGHAPVVRELTVPVFRENKIVAVIGVGNKARDYNDQDVSVVARVADIAFDFVERKRAEQQIQFIAYNDVLTGLPNRQLLSDRLTQAASLSRRSEKLLAICYMDMDDFKPVNDRYGHKIGDQLLIQLTHRLREDLREGDTLARLGGDEFVILLNGLGTIYHGEETVQRLLEGITQPFEIDGYRVHISASIGVTLFPQDDADPDTLLRHADQAMYKAKASGKNTYSLYDPIQNQKLHAYRKAIEEFERALEQAQLILHYQPRIDLRSGDLASVEALVRWQHPEQGLLPPGKFLPMIEDSPLEIALDEWVMQAALDQHIHWREQGLALPVSVNLSPRHIQQRNFPEYLMKLLSRFPADIARYLELEVLETSAIGDTAQVAEIMNACAELGVDFSLDDFGTGYSSLTYFHRLPISVLKIDQHFVRNMLDDPRDQDIVEGVLRLADALKRPVVAEGVESIELGLMLLQMGCRYAQGYGIAKPMPAEALLDWSAAWRTNSLWHELQKETQGLTELYDLNVSIFTHRHWLHKVNEFLQSGLTTDRPQPDENNRHFIRWYKGLGASRYGGHPQYAFILAKHTALHELANELIAVAGKHGAKQALTRLDELNSRGKDLIAMLRKLAER